MSKINIEKETSWPFILRPTSELGETTGEGNCRWIVNLLPEQEEFNQQHKELYYIPDTPINRRGILYPPKCRYEIKTCAEYVAIGRVYLEYILALVAEGTGLSREEILRQAKETVGEEEWNRPLEAEELEALGRGNFNWREFIGKIWAGPSKKRRLNDSHTYWETSAKDAASTFVHTLHERCKWVFNWVPKQ